MDYPARMSGAGWEAAMEMGGEALRVMMRTALGMMLLALILSGVAFYIAYEGTWWHGVLAVLLTLVNAAILGSILSVKRAVLGALARGLQKQKLGQSVASMVFKPDGPLGKVADRVPLAEAERRLRSAVEAVLSKRAQQTGLRARFARSIQTRCLEGIEQVTLTRFRADAAEQGGGVDLAKIGAELGDRADQLLFNKVHGAANKLTAVMMLASSGIAVLVALALRQIPG
jgi:hypothetical protein